MSYSNDRRDDPGPIPERWLKCPRKSSDLLNKKFLVFKTPLSEKFNDQVPEQYRFPPSFIFSSMKSYKVKVGLWIDLTNTSRFYDRKEVQENGCRYIKIKCRGRGETPTPEQTSEFARICDTFIRQHPLEIIGVHCTHGFNRSGFLIASYLVTVLDWGLDAALAEFTKIRPPGIYKKDYIDELYRRFDEIESAIDAPPTPEWCLEFDGEDSDGEQYEQASSNKRKSGTTDETGIKKKRRFEKVKENPKFMEGIYGVVPVMPPLLTTIQQRVQDLCGYEKAGFPGSQPVSMNRQNIQFLQDQPYRVSWKADGTRYLLYIQNKNEIFCIDRDNSVFQVTNLSFPYRKDLHAHLKDTLLDGEMVMDKVNGENVPRFLIYDIITICNFPIRQENFHSTRYEAIRVDIIGPREEAMKRGLLNKLLEPFSIRRKEFSDVRDAGKYLSDRFCRALAHEPDGLIFQPSHGPYITGRCDTVLKWKPSSLNSVDFRLKITKESGMGIVAKKIGELYVGGFDKRFSTISPIRDIQHLDGKIIECTYANNKWVFLRERTDKSFPNSYDTANAVCDSIRHPVTKEYLLSFIDESRYIPEMAPPDFLPLRFQRHS